MLIRISAALVALVANSGILNAEARSIDIGGSTKQPIGHFEFCNRWPGECTITKMPRGPEAMDEEAWTAVSQLNQRINSKIVAKTDQELHGTEERWSFPDGSGDCEDYALLKRRILIEKHGFSPSNVLLTVVERKNGEGHAILTLRTTEGEYLLDNLHAAVRPWTAAKEYRFVKRQSSANSRKWVSIGLPGAAPALSAGSKP